MRDCVLRMLLLPFPSLYDQPAGVRASRRGFNAGPLGTLFWSFFALFRIFFAFWAQRESSWHFFAFFFSFFFDFLSILDGFGKDFGRVLEGFFEGFSILS